MDLRNYQPGNIVYPKDYEGKVIDNPIRIIEIYGDECSFQFMDSKNMPDKHLEVKRLSKIPLTIEWIKVFGFENIGGNSWCKDEIRVEFKDNGKFESVFFIGETKPIPLFEESLTVSELQNLYFFKNRKSLI